MGAYSRLERAMSPSWPVTAREPVRYQLELAPPTTRFFSTKTPLLTPLPQHISWYAAGAPKHRYEDLSVVSGRRSGLVVSCEERPPGPWNRSAPRDDVREMERKGRFQPGLASKPRMEPLMFFNFSSKGSFTVLSPKIYSHLCLFEPQDLRCCVGYVIL